MTWSDLLADPTLGIGWTSDLLRPLPTRMILWFFCCCHVFLQSTNNFNLCQTQGAMRYSFLRSSNRYMKAEVLEVTEIDVP